MVPTTSNPAAAMAAGLYGKLRRWCSTPPGFCPGGRFDPSIPYFFTSSGPILCVSALFLQLPGDDISLSLSETNTQTEFTHSVITAEGN